MKIFLRLALFIAFIQFARAQDQILDGIGETGMVARYLFNGDLKDWSRNNLHAKGTGINFVNDARFGKVLSLLNSSVEIPGEALDDLESVSITSWIYLRSNQPGQHILDFFEVPVELNKWVHVAVVVDVASKSLHTYIDSKRVAEVRDIALPGGETKLHLGKADALMHDLRIYRIALTEKQVAGIYRGINAGAVNTGRRAEEPLPQFSHDEAQLYNAYLVSVPDVEVETATGNLPRLPAYVQGTYKNQIKGPKVRVLWPAETDNSAVLKPGRYTITGRVAGTNFQPKAFITVKNNKSTTPPLQLKAFNLSLVSLKTETQFAKNRDKYIRALAKTDPNTFLYMFRHAFGQQQPGDAKPLSGWDSKDTKLRGHATGHYLTAIAQAYASTGYDQALQANFYSKIEQMLNTLYELSQLSGKAKEPGSAHVSDPSLVPPGLGKTSYDSDLSDSAIRNDYWNWGKGFISAYPPDQFIMLENGAKYGGQKHQIWAPYYTLHKILAGLMDVYEVSGNKKALNIATGMSDWVYARLSKVPTDTLIKMWNTYIAGEFGGMNEVMARVYRITGNKNYLKTAQLFDNIRVFYGDTAHSHGLAKNVDLFRGLHANQHIPQVVGSVEMYRVTNNPEYYKIADNFWYKMVNDYMYSIGGVAGARNPNNAECFTAQPGTLYENGFAAGGQNETCATYNMLKLTSDLFLFDPRADLMDYYERALYNHILASVAENTPANTYHVPLRPGSVKQFGNGEMKGFTCCNGTSIESNTKLQNSIYFQDSDSKSLYINLYIPSTLNWAGRNVMVEQETNFPNEDNTRLTIKGNGKFDINVRVPGWATKGFFVKINGKEQKISAKPGSYLKINRSWKNGDVIELRMPFTFHLDPVMDQQNIASLFYGPILLAAQESDPIKEWRKITLDAEDISKSIKGDPRQLEFTIDGIVFKPFYETYGRHSVYLDVKLK